MAEYIEREAITDGRFVDVENEYQKGWNDALEGAYFAIPTADVVEVKHGEWKEINNIVIENGMLTVKGTTWCCNVCGEARKTLTKPNMNYCPNCGADMRGRTNDL